MFLQRNSRWHSFFLRRPKNTQSFWTQSVGLNNPVPKKHGSISEIRRQVVRADWSRVGAESLWRDRTANRGRRQTFWNSLIQFWFAFFFLFGLHIKIKTNSPRRVPSSQPLADPVLPKQWASGSSIATLRALYCERVCSSQNIIQCNFVCPVGFRCYQMVIFTLPLQRVFISGCDKEVSWIRAECWERVLGITVVILPIIYLCAVWEGVGAALNKRLKDRLLPCLKSWLNWINEKEKGGTIKIDITKLIVVVGSMEGTLYQNVYKLEAVWFGSVYRILQRRVYYVGNRMQIWESLEQLKLAIRIKYKQQGVVSLAKC